MSAVLTNVVGYSYIFGVQMMLGNFLIFLTGMMFGPLIGTVSAIITDTIGSLINMGGAYHAGFMLIKVILGVSGGLVFLFKTNAY
jgi:ECF transporter S component (folate family)